MASNKKYNQNKAIAIGEEIRIAVLLNIQKFMNSEQAELEFPSSFTSVERAYVHKLVPTYGLKSKSRGKGMERYITVYKRNRSTIVQGDATFILDSPSRVSIYNLITKYPITLKEKTDVLPMTERDRNATPANNVMYREIKTTGRLTDGIPQIPCLSEQQDLIAFRRSLPVWNMKNDIITAIEHNPVVVVCGQTGSGKTTQIPQFVLDQYSRLHKPCRVICTQPRRLSAVSVSERVAAERNEKISQSIGYQIRLESRVGTKTVLTYCTNGVLLRTLMAGDSALASITHIIIDEIHERDKFSDYLLIVLKDSLTKFRHLRVILMSATIDTTIFCNYFNNCPVLNVPGRLFDVHEFFLEDVLRLTGYFSSDMKRIKNGLHKKTEQQEQLQTWTADFTNFRVSETSSASKSNSYSASKPRALLGQYFEPVPERVDLDPELISVMDQCLTDCWLIGDSNCFGQFQHMVLSENISVDYQHSGTGCTGLMLAAGRGDIENVEQLLNLGSNVNMRSSNNWTAYDWATQHDHIECAELIQAYSDPGSLALLAKPATSGIDSCHIISPADKTALDVYSQSFNSDENIDRDLILALVGHIHGTKPFGSILVFLPGYDDIVNLRDMINGDEDISKNGSYQIFTLHSNMQTSDQKRVFQHMNGIRKIILSTNIAETSITIDDVVYVIDSGKVKQKQFDAISGSTMLTNTWISKACSKQRAGRAGRTRSGECYHLFSSVRYHEGLQAYTTPEILRTPLQALCLHTKLLAPLNTAIADFLGRAIEPPSSMVTRQAVDLLKTIGALDSWEELTEIGSHLVDVPVEPKLAKMLIYSVILKCLDPVLTIVSCLAYKDPFVIPSQPYQKRAVMQVRKKFADDTFSDHMVLLRAFQLWQNARASGMERSFCERHFLNSATLQQIVGTRAQLLGLLRAAGFVKARGAGDVKDLNAFSENWAVVKAAIAASMYPSLCRIDRDHATLRTQKENKVFLHPSSALRSIKSESTTRINPSTKAHHEALVTAPSEWLVFEEKSRTGHWCFLKGVTMITPVTVALFAGPMRISPNAVVDLINPGFSSDSDSDLETKAIKNNSAANSMPNATFTVDDWTVFKVDSNAAHLIHRLRMKWNAMFIKRMANPNKTNTQIDEVVLRTIVDVLTAEEKLMGFSQPSGIGQRPRPLIPELTQTYPNDSCHNNTGAIRKHTNDHYNRPTQLSVQNHPNGCDSARNNTMNNQYNRSVPVTVQNNSNVGGESIKSTTNPLLATIEAKMNADAEPINNIDTKSKATRYMNNCTNSESGKNGAVNVNGTDNNVEFDNCAFFIMKCNSPMSLRLAFQNDIWLTGSFVERKFSKVIQSGKRVLLIFSSSASSQYQGLAEMVLGSQSQGSVETRGHQTYYNNNNQTTSIKLRWLSKKVVPFGTTRHLVNTLNLNRHIYGSRDGQELDEVCGRSLASMFL